MKIETHPCFSSCCTEYARIHLPVAPLCNMQCNYCVRKFSCANETRPGVTIKVMEPEEVFRWYQKAKATVPKLTVVGIARPGDTLVNWTKVVETLNLIRAYDKEVQFCISTNGLLLPKYIDALINADVEFVTVTVNAVHPEVGAKIYSFIEYENVTYQGVPAAELLWQKQQEGIRKLVAAGACVKINTVDIPGINLEEIPKIAQAVGELGCEVHNIIPMLPAKESVFGAIHEPDAQTMLALRKACQKYLRQLQHCTRCRADAVGKLCPEVKG
ncbi:MAG: radical SAM protein [Phascolarctobacterium sp.]|nr:radical SAM protein [Phascolarctobacterium sp.]